MKKLIWVLIVGVVLGMVGCGHTAKSIQETEAQQLFDSYLVAKANDQAYQEFRPTFQKLTKLGEPGLRRIFDMLCTLDPSLVEAGVGPEWEENVGYHAIQWIAKQGKLAIPMLLEYTNSKSDVARAYAYHCLIFVYKHRNSPVVREAFLKGLKDPYFVVRKVSVVGCTKTKETIPEIIEMLEDSDRGVRESAIRALVEVDIGKAIPQLIELLKDKDEMMRGFAVLILRDCGVKEAIPELIELLEDGSSYVRGCAAGVLEDFGVKEAIPRLIELLKDEDSGVRSSAAGALGGLGAKEAIPQLTELLKDKFVTVRCNVAEVLGKLGAKEAIPEIAKLLEDGAWLVRCNAVEALGNLDAKETAPEIAKLLEDENKRVRYDAQLVLKEWGVEIPKEENKDK